MQVECWKSMEEKLERNAREFLMEAYGIELKIPVVINPRLKKVYGRFRYYKNRKESIRIEMSKNYIMYQDWKTIYETLKHECIHHALYELDKPYRDGDSYFESELKKHGSHSTGTVEYKGKVVEYICTGCNRISRVKRRYPRNGAGYVCGRCESPIKFHGEKILV